MQEHESTAKDPGEAVTAAEFRHVSGLFPSGVTVVTRRLPDGRPYGMTVSSFTSVSLLPPLVLVCIDRAANFLRDLSLGSPFVINILSDSQQEVARRFASKKEDDRFKGIDWSPNAANVPKLNGITASFDCRLDQSIEAGDHFLLIGAVDRVQQHQGLPLVWCNRDYHCLPRP